MEFINQLINFNINYTSDFDLIHQQYELLKHNPPNIEWDMIIFDMKSRFLRILNSASTNYSKNMIPSITNLITALRSCERNFHINTRIKEFKHFVDKLKKFDSYKVEIYNKVNQSDDNPTVILRCVDELADKLNACHSILKRYLDSTIPLIQPSILKEPETAVDKLTHEIHLLNKRLDYMQTVINMLLKENEKLRCEVMKLNERVNGN
jgi:hypothetical protein